MSVYAVVSDESVFGGSCALLFCGKAMPIQAVR